MEHRVISMILGDKEIARIEDGDGVGTLKYLIEFDRNVEVNLNDWYNDCFYGVQDASTFDDRFRLVREHNYFCFTKPALQLAARTLKEE